MPNKSPHGNLTAVLVVIAFLELVIDRLIGRLFLSPGCHTGIGCLLLRGGPFLLHLTGTLTVMIGAAGMLGHLRRGELIPKGMRLTIAVLSLIFLMLVGLSLLLGRMPGRYQVHLETSFGFVVALLGLSFVGSDTVSLRTRIGFVLFALPALLHIAALVAARAGWLNHGAISPERLTSLGELTLLLAAITSPILLLPRGVPATRLGAGLALAAGVSAFFFVALLGRSDLVQTVALYSVQLELPRALSILGFVYVLALFGFVTSMAVLLFSAGSARLSGLGICLIGIAGYQTSSPVALGLSFCGLLALATGLVRAGSTNSATDAPLSESAWRSLLGTIAKEVGDPPAAGTDPVLIEVTSTLGSAGGGSDVGSIKAVRRGRPIVLRLRRLQATVRQIDVTVGAPGDATPDATIESHETWLGRRQEDRVSLPRVKTGDIAFDRKMGVHGHVALHAAGLRRRILRLSQGTMTVWTGRAARYVAPGNPHGVGADEGVPRIKLSSGPGSVRALVELVDTLIDLVEAEVQTAPPDAA